MPIENKTPSLPLIESRRLPLNKCGFLSSLEGEQKIKTIVVSKWVVDNAFEGFITNNVQQAKLNI